MILAATNSFGQLNPLGAQYFHNPYLVNPSMAGMEAGYEVAAAVKGQWTGIEGAPVMQGVTLTNGIKNSKVGLGLNLYNEAAGAIRRTVVKATYAYHLKLDDNEKFMDFGLSAGLVDEWLDQSKLRGELADVSVYRFNQRKLFFDVDFGTTYRHKGITLQGILPNIRRTWFSNEENPLADKFRYLLAGSYKLVLTSASIEPMIVYRNVQNYGDIFDVAAALSLQEERLVFNAIYHTTNSVTLGIGTNYKKQLAIMFQYTTNTSDLQGYSNGEAELSVRLRF